MLNQKEPLMPATSKWLIKIGRDSFKISNEQMEILKKATQDGNINIVWFKDFAISIPHIESITRENTIPSTWSEIPELSPDQIIHNRELIEKARKKLKNKLAL
jgi:hypothetical protein